MATWDDVRELAMALPSVTEGEGPDTLSWKVEKKQLAWERPLRKRDIEELGDDAPDGPILGASVADEGEKRALVEGEPDVFFTTSHFNGYAAVLIQLDRIDRARLGEVLTEAWLARAPKKLVAQFRPPSPSVE